MTNTKRKYKEWTKAEEDKLMEMYDRGLSHTEIAKNLKRSRSAVNGRIYRLKHGKAEKLPEAPKVVILPEPQVELEPVAPEYVIYAWIVAAFIVGSGIGSYLL